VENAVGKAALEASKIRENGYLPRIEPLGSNRSKSSRWNGLAANSGSHSIGLRFKPNAQGKSLDFHNF
jgi:hypothetical protein